MTEKQRIIKTNHLALRPLALSDLDTAHAYAGDIANTKYMMFLPNDTIQETEQFLQRAVAEWQKENPQFYEFAVTLNEKHIGAVSVYLDDNRQEGELGWIIHKAYHGKGYATEAAQAVLSFACNELKLHKVVAHCDYRNAPSCRVMQKIGLLLESDQGVRRYKDEDQDVRESMYSLMVCKDAD